MHMVNDKGEAVYYNLVRKNNKDYWLVQGIGSTVVYGRDRERRKSRHFTQEQQAERYLARHGFRPDRPPFFPAEKTQRRNTRMNGLLIDCFAGGGGASKGIELALNRPIDIAINHDPEAIRIHRVNHPHTLHLTEDIFTVDLPKYVAGRPVDLMWASPDCTSHSKAKGGQPRHQGLRILPWAVYKHAKAILPEVIIMENVEEIQQWGPLDATGRPIKERAGEDYNKFISSMCSLGYAFDSRELVAADYGAPTTRKRWYAIFRRDKRPIIWPAPTHSKEGRPGTEKWVPCGDFIDWSDLGRSIFLVEGTPGWDIWRDACRCAEDAYFDMLTFGCTPQEARSVLPNSLKTEVVMTANLREWRHFFKLRTAPAAHPQMRELAVPLLHRMQELVPVVFDDLEVPHEKS